MATLLDIQHLSVELPTPRGWVRPVRNVSLTLAPGECLGLVGESGSGKTMLMLALVGLLPPGARHERHRHPNCDEFLIVLSGRGEVYTDVGEDPSETGDVVFTPAGHWHGFNNTSDEDVVLLWGWRGAGSLERAGYELP